MKIGYVRVSKQEQHEALQIDALKKAGCEKWFVDKITGSKAERKGLGEALVHSHEWGLGMKFWPEISSEMQHPIQHW